MFLGMFCIILATTAPDFPSSESAPVCEAFPGTFQAYAQSHFCHTIKRTCSPIYLVFEDYIDGDRYSFCLCMEVSVHRPPGIHQQRQQQKESNKGLNFKSRGGSLSTKCKNRCETCCRLSLRNEYHLTNTCDYLAGETNPCRGSMQ